MTTTTRIILIVCGVLLGAEGIRRLIVIIKGGKK